MRNSNSIAPTAHQSTAGPAGQHKARRWLLRMIHSDAEEAGNRKNDSRACSARRAPRAGVVPVAQLQMASYAKKRSFFVHTKKSAPRPVTYRAPCPGGSPAPGSRASPRLSPRAPPPRRRRFPNPGAASGEAVPGASTSPFPTNPGTRLIGSPSIPPSRLSTPSPDTGEAAMPTLTPIPIPFCRFRNTGG